MRYLISSHVDYYETTVRPLLESLTTAGIDPEMASVYVAGAAQEAKGYLGSAELYFVAHNSFEHTALIEFAANPTDDCAFLLHDTCLAGPRFGELSGLVTGCQHAPADPAGWTNMGYFSAAFLVANRDYLESLRGCSKRRAQMSERVYTRLADPCGSYGARGPVEMGQSKPYGGAPRLKVYYPCLDLYKFMANHAGAGRHYTP